MFDHSDIANSIIDEIENNYKNKIDDITDDIIEDYLHREVDDYVSCLHFKLNKEIIEIDCNKDIFEVISDYNDEYGELDFKSGRAHFYAILAFYAILNYTDIREHVSNAIYLFKLNQQELLVLD